MIVGEQKPLKEIKESVAAYKKLLILGCGTCVKTCFAGGEDEVALLASSLRLAFKKDGQTIEIEELTVERQCENEFIQEAAKSVTNADAVLSLACGAGVQAIAKRFMKAPVFPGCRERWSSPKSARDAVIVNSPYSAGCVPLPAAPSGC